jgi:tetratricopeptide (TPR) repeat protein
LLKRCGEKLLALSEHPEDAFDATRGGWTPPAWDLTIFRARALLALGRAQEASTLVAPLWSQDTAPRPEIRRALLVTLEAALALCERERADEAASRLAAFEDAGSTEPSATLRRLSDRAWRWLAPFAQPLQPEASRPAHVCPDVFALAAQHGGQPDRAGIENGRLGWALLLAGRGPEAAAQFERVLRDDDPSPPPALLRGLGEAHLANGAREKAFAAFRRAAQASPADSADAWHAWTRLLDLMSTSSDAAERSPAIRREIARLRALPHAERFPVGLERLRIIENRLGTPSGTADGTATPAVR